MNVSEPLSDEELNRLSQFLLDRVDEKAEEEEGFDCGIIDVSELDGFLTAIVSGPQMLVPSVWLPAVWGDAEPVWESTSEFESIFGLMVRHMNDIAEMLAVDRESFEPLFNERRVEGESHLIVDEWCCGYMRACGLVPGWQQHDPKLSALLHPIECYGTEHGWRTIDGMNGDEARRIRDAIPASAREIYAYCLRYRDSPRTEPLRRAAAKVGRNDPCPCGSGKKYKHCCLQ